MLDSMHQTRELMRDMDAKYDRNIEFVQETQKLVRSYQASLDTMLQVVRDNTTRVDCSAAPRSTGSTLS